MFSFFRRGIGPKLMLSMLGLALFAMVVTGFGTGGMGSISGLVGGGSSLASVEGETIASTEAKDQVDRQLDRMHQQQPELDLATFLRGGALEEIVDQLVVSSSLLAFGHEQGLAASKAMVDREILGIPAFQNLAGSFDEAAFRQALDREKISERKLRAEIEASLVQRQLMLPVASSSYVPRGLAFQYASLLLESRSGTVGLVPTAAMGAGSEPTDAEVAAFFRGNQARYTVPERRVLRYAMFGPEQVAEQARATDAEIAALYRQEAAAYSARESRVLAQVVLPDEASARAFAARIAGGMSFAAAASQAGFSAADTALGEQSKEAYARSSGPAVAQAAFAAAKGATTAPVKSPLGWHIVRVEDIKVAPARSLETVRDQLAAQIGQRKTQDALVDLAAKIEKALDEGSSFADIARAEKLAIVETPPVTAAGAAPDNGAWRTPPELTPLLKAAFEMTEDEDPVVETIVANQRFALLAVAKVVTAAPPPLAQIAARVKADLVARRAADRARAVAASLVAKINAGTPPALAFAQAGVRLPAPQPVTATRRDIAQQNRQVPPPLAMLFSLPRGKARLLAAPDGTGWFVVHLGTVVPGDARREPQLTEAIRGQFSQILGDEYAQQFTRAVQAELDIERNPEAVARLKAEMLGNSGAQ